MADAAAVARKSWPTLLRLLTILAILVLEAEAVEIWLRRHFDGRNYQASFWAPAWDYRPYFLVFLVLFVPALIIAAGPRVRVVLAGFLRAAETHRWAPVLALQVVSYLGFVLLTYTLSTRSQELGNLAPVVGAVWFLLMLSTATLGLWSLAPGRFWLDLARRERLTFLAAGILSVGTASLVFWFREWRWLGDVTFRFSEWLLRLVYGDVVSNFDAHQLGRGEFQVEISRACSGYEGIVLVVVFLCLYLWVFRRDFRFPRTLVVFPIGILLIWTFNAVRIATLIAIGASFSPEIAVAGFHSNAGWIAFIAVTIGSIWVLHHMPFFATAVTAAPTRGGAVQESTHHASDALLVPLLALLATTLLTSLFSAGFDWLYPVRVLATGAALWYFWRSYGFERFLPAVEPFLIGGAVFVGWLMLVPGSEERTSDVASGLSAAPTLAAGIWVFFRFIGSAITVPLAEELAFRGYLLARLSGTAPTVGGRVPFTWISFLVSSVLFGLFHDAWIAGSLAGMAYAFARYRRGAIGDAVVAHMTTNALLSGYVLLTQQWSYW